MITLEDLRKRATYFQENGEKLRLRNSSKPLFVDGEFNDENWAGGDALIRQFCYILEADYFGAFKVYGNKDEQLICKLLIHEDQTYVSFVHIETCLFDEDKTPFNSVETFVDKYEFEWYKSRGRIDSARYNNSKMTEENYLALLNKIEELTGVKLDLSV